jgi:hypothetical protein
MIIKTKSPKETKIAASLRDALRYAGVEVYLVPEGIDGFFITIDDERNELVVIASNDTEDIDRVYGFNSVQECLNYAEFVAKEAGISKDNIYADVWDK